MVPIHIKITEEMHDLLSQVAKHHGLPAHSRIDKAIYPPWFDAEDVGYSGKRQRFLIN